MSLDSASAILKRPPRRRRRRLDVLADCSNRPSKPKKTVTAKPAMKKKPDNNNCQAMLAPDEPVDVASMPVMRMYTRRWSTIHVGPYRLWKLDSLDWDKRTATVTETWVPSRSHS